MRIVYISRNFLPSLVRGSESLVYKMAKGAIDKGNEAFVITSRISTEKGLFFPYPIGKLKREEEKIDNISIIRLDHYWFIYLIAYVSVRSISILQRIPLVKKFKFFNNINSYLNSYASGVYFKNLEETIEKLNPDIVHATPLPHYHTIQSIKAVLNINKRKDKKIKIVVSPAMHLTDVNFSEIYNISQLKFSFESVDKIITYTEYEKEQVSKQFKIPINKIEAIPIGIEDIKNKPNPSSEFLKSFGNSIMNYRKEGYIAIFFLAQKCYKKGLFNLIKALKKIQDADKFILIIGGPSTLSWKIFKLFHKYPFILDIPALSNNDKDWIFANSDIFAMPSIVDSYGIVYIEAMKYSIPIFYAKTPAQTEIIDGAGLASSFYDIDDISKKLKSFINDNNIREKLGKRARELFETRYMSDEMINKLVDLYKII